MKEFFRWWYTNKNNTEYMSMLQCAINDTPTVFWMGIILVITCLQYADVAYHNWSIAKNYSDSNTKKYLMFFTLVFIFCALAGYGYRLMSIWFNPYKLLILMLIILNVVTYGFRKYMKRTNAVENLFIAEQNTREKYSILKKELVAKITAQYASDDVDLITYEQLLTLDENVWYPVDGKKIKLMPIDMSGEVLLLRTVMEAGEYFGWQKHNCYEKVFVRSGVFLDCVNGNKFKTGEVKIYDEEEKHNPYAATKVSLDVYFSKFPFDK